MAVERPNLLCVSINPAIDRRIRVSHLQIAAVNRALSADPAAGGKAAHVGFAAHALGADVRWLAFVGGMEGEACRAGIAARGLAPVVVNIAGRTRMTLEVIDEITGKVTEVLEPGPSISESEQSDFLQVFAHELLRQPIVVLSGSLPAGLETSFYAQLVTLAKNAGCRVLLDTSGEALAHAIAVGPDVIKPNREEAGALLGRSLQGAEDAVDAARTLHRRGPDTVIISLGVDGAVASQSGQTLRGVAPAVRSVSTVGSGDSFLAGWAIGIANGFSFDDRMKLAIACGTANCLAQSPGMISRADVDRLFTQVQIEFRS